VRVSYFSFLSIGMLYVRGIISDLGQSAEIPYNLFGFSFHCYTDVSMKNKLFSVQLNVDFYLWSGY
jgi:hypothetical protein